MKMLDKYADHAYALMRIITGLMFTFHGVQKIFGVLADRQTALFSQSWFGGLIELVGGALVLLGFYSRWAAFVCSGTMAVAYFQFHWKFQLGAQFFPTINRGELAVLYCFVFLLIFTRGGVKWCINNK